MRPMLLGDLKAPVGLLEFRDGGHQQELQLLQEIMARGTCVVAVGRRDTSYLTAQLMATRHTTNSLRKN